MRKEYKNILDEMVINEDVINHHTDGRKLLMDLQVHKVLSYQETEELYQMGPTKSIQHLMKNVLQSRNDEAMNHFLNSLKKANYDDAYMWLKGKLADITLKTAWDNLKVNYGVRLKYVESFWRQVGVKGILNMDTFYNHNIVISNEKYKQVQEKIENFDDMFSTGYKRIIITAETGYGKSTFVHEMARQWVEGDKGWTNKFAFLFLFRLSEVNENESGSLENLLALCLYPNDASKVYNWLIDGNMSKALFIFDGLDELRQDFYGEVNEVIFGGKVNLPTVVITSRQCQKLEGIKNDVQPQLYIELKGYTNEGVIQQLKRFSIPYGGMKKDLKNHLKIPLFNTIFCITHSESRLACANNCSSIHIFINSAIKRYRNSNQSFTASCEEELLLTLGQAAQNKFRFIQNVEIPYPNVSRDHLSWAVKSGLIHNSSCKEDLIFAHRTIAEYCAAYFWGKTKRLVMEESGLIIVKRIYLTEPPNGSLNFTEPFSQFLCLLHPKFKEDLWRKFRSCVPIFDEYESLPDILRTERLLQFSAHSIDDQLTIMNKLSYQGNGVLILINGQFEPEKLFTTIRKLKKLYLIRCTFKIGAEEFFIHFTNVQSLIFENCKFYDLNTVYDGPDSDESNPPSPPHLPLQKLEIRNCSLGIETFLSFVMKHSALMKTFELHTRSFHNLWRKDISPEEEKHSKNVSIENDVDDCGISWINELQNNKRLCLSIENCELCFAYPSILIPIIETFKKMQNLKTLNLRVLHKLTKLEANAFADFLEAGLPGLEDIDLNIKMEIQQDYEPILKNLSKLSALTSLHLWNEPFTTDTLKYLAYLFDRLKLEKCELEYQEIFFHERIINSINSGLSLKNIILWTKKMEDSNFELFKKRTENKDRQLRIIKVDWYWK